MLSTPFGPLRVDVLEVCQVELGSPSDDPGDRLHAASHARAHDSATDVAIEVIRNGGERIAMTTPMAKPGPLIAMKLQAVDNRSAAKQGTDLLDIVRLTLDEETRTGGLTQIAAVDDSVAHDIRRHVDLWLVQRRAQAVQRIRAAGGADVIDDDLALAAELLLGATMRRR